MPNKVAAGIIPVAILLVILLAVLLFQLVNHLPWLKTPNQQTPQQQIRLYRHVTTETITIPLEEYIVSVVAAEMPAAFPVEALKAQAVAARTYTVRRLQPGSASNHVYPGADICDDPRYSQAWISKQQMKERWGQAGYHQYYNKIKRAVDSTKGQVLTYNNELINAVYHASCGGGATENSGEVWQFDKPYLKSVSCPFCADPRRVQSVSYTLDEVSTRLQTDLKAIPAAAGSSQIIKVKEQTGTGRPKVLLVGDRSMPATVFREKLSLRSTRFTYQLEDDKITFTTTGHGHGVGMCQ